MPSFDKGEIARHTALLSPRQERVFETTNEYRLQAPKILICVAYHDYDSFAYTSVQSSGKESEYAKCFRLEQYYRNYFSISKNSLPCFRQEKFAFCIPYSVAPLFLLGVSPCS